MLDYLKLQVHTTYMEVIIRVHNENKGFSINAGCSLTFACKNSGHSLGFHSLCVHTHAYKSSPNSPSSNPMTLYAYYFHFCSTERQH